MKIIFFALAATFIAWSDTLVDMQDQKISYLALGDSYTIGEAVGEKERWPAQLVTRLNADGLKVEQPRIIATTGWTTDELLAAIEKANIEETYEMVSLLIGVNNQYRGYPLEQYSKEFEVLLKLAIKFAGESPEKVFVVSIPDYGVTPFMTERDGDEEKIAKEIDEYNAVAMKICQTKGVRYTYITEGSKAAKSDQTLVAPDGLHPSGKMYTQWVNEVYQSVFDDLSSR